MKELPVQGRKRVSFQCYMVRFRDGLIFTIVILLKKRYIYKTYILAQALLSHKEFSVDLSPYIKELIMVHECIILPDFGGIETSYLPAHYDNEQKHMIPPGKKVWFRSDYIRGGEVLENHLVEQLNIEPEKARKIIEEYITEIKTKLKNNQDTVISGVGVFRKKVDGELTFTAFSDENYLADSFGLESFPFEKKEPIIKENKLIKEAEIFIRKRSNTLMYVIVGVIVICILMTITMFFASKFHLNLFNIGNSGDNEMVIIGGTLKSDSLSIAIDKELENYTSVKNALSYSNNKEIEPETRPANVYTYFLVAGSFSSFENADKLNDELVEDGFSSEVLEIKDSYRVCLGKFVDKDSALNELQRIRKQIDRSVWLFSTNNE